MKVKHSTESLHLTCWLLIHLIKTDDRNDMCDVRVIWKEDKNRFMFQPERWLQMLLPA